MTLLRTMLVGGLLLGSVARTTEAQQVADPYYEFLLARHLEDDGDGPGALAALERAAKADPGSADIRAEIAAVRLRQNDVDAAQRAARAALAIDAGNAEANRVLGLVSAAAIDDAPAGDLAPVREAIGYLEKAVAGLKGLPDANLYYMLGRLYLRANEPAKAAQALVRVVLQNPDSPQVRLSLAQAQAGSDDLPGAIQTLEEVLPQEPRVAALLAQYQQQAGRPADAARTYAQAIEQQPTNRDLRMRRIAALYDAKAFTQAAAEAADAIRQFPQDARFPRLRASAVLAVGDQAGALAALEEASKAFPRDAATQLALVSLYHTAGRTSDAERVLRQVLAVEPSNPDALNFLGYLLADSGQRLDEAVALVTRALEHDPENGSYLDSLGWAHFQRGELDQAAKYLSAAAERLPRNSEVQAHLGDLEARRQRWPEAIAAWTRALDGDGEDIDRPTVERKISDARTRLHDAR